MLDGEGELSSDACYRAGCRNNHRPDSRTVRVWQNTYDYTGWSSSCYDHAARCTECGTITGSIENMAHIRNFGAVCSDCLMDASSCPRCMDNCYSLDYEVRGQMCCEDCYDAWQEENNRVIFGYHGWGGDSTPVANPWSTRHRGLYFGVELEVESIRGDREENASSILETAKHIPELRPLYDAERLPLRAEEDGSLDDGFELITLPFGLPDHRKLWRSVLNRTNTRNIRSHSTETCGLHIHVSRAALTPTQLARMVIFVNDPNNEKLVRAIARRYHCGYSRVKNKTWAGVVREVRLDRRHDNDRYELLNLTNQHTVEFRMFRGSTNPDAVVGALEFVNALVRFCGQSRINNEDVNGLNFLRYLTSHALRRETKTLREYLMNRGVSWDAEGFTVGKPVSRKESKPKKAVPTPVEQIVPYNPDEHNPDDDCDLADERARANRRIA
jgi:hypothetical protein